MTRIFIPCTDTKPKLIDIATLELISKERFNIGESAPSSVDCGELLLDALKVKVVKEGNSRSGKVGLIVVGSVL
jgi:hypothetical protein